MSSLKVVEPPSETKTYFSLLEQLALKFKSAGLATSEASILAMHLAEIDEEASKYYAHITNLRRDKSEGYNASRDELLEQLVDVELSLEHLRSHVEAVSDLLSKSIDELDTEE